VITRMGEATTASYVRVVNQNLGSLTTTARESDTQDQKDAIERLGGLKDAAVKVVGQISGGRAADDDRTIQAFMMIPAARAVWVYKWDVFYAWAGGIAIDLIPTILVVLLTLGRARAEEELERDAQAAAQPVAMPRTVARTGTWPGGQA